jgi:NAD(P)-dependent dehydrogenase (short-subunit alcohol dehydrogenase family)
MSGQLRGKRILITGGAQGIGVRAYVREGGLVAIVDLTENPDEIKSYLDRIHPLGYCPAGDVIADASVFLLSNAARFITGCILPVSGGAELGYRL